MALKLHSWLHWHVNTYLWAALCTFKSSFRSFKGIMSVSRNWSVNLMYAINSFFSFKGRWSWYLREGRMHTPNELSDKMTRSIYAL